MNKRMNFMFTIAAIAVMGGALFGSSFTSQMTGAAFSTDVNVLQKIHDMGGLELVMPAAFAEAGNCDSDEYADRTVVEFPLTGVSIDLPRLGGGTFSAMTFSEQIPGPTLRVTQGDVVKMTLTIPEGEPTPHGNDMHASQVSAVPTFGAVQPGTSKTYCYIAEVPGVYKYHCSGVNIAAMDQHVLQGMYGIAIVDPIGGYSTLVVEKTQVNANGDVTRDRQFHSGDALEWQIQYNQMYLTDEGTYDATAMFAHQTTYTAVNGQPFGYVPNMIHNLLNGDANKNIFVAQPWNSMDLKQYQSQLLFTPTGVHNRIFVENHGNEPVFFHIVGEILDRVTQGSRVQSAGTETWLLGGSQNMIVDLVFDEPGIYALVNHDYAAIFTGAATIYVAGLPLPTINETATALGVVQGAVDAGAYSGVLGNPYDAIPPYGEQSIMHPAKNVHCMCSDSVAASQAAEGAVELWVAVPAILEAAAAAAEE
jgi:nitrite reductase (NO-forming)